jgi:hypothetical protein
MVYMRYIIFPHAVRFQIRTTEIDWGLFYAVITDFYLPPDTVKKKIGLYWELPGFQFDGMGIPIASKSRGI